MNVNRPPSCSPHNFPREVCAATRHSSTNFHRRRPLRKNNLSSGFGIPVPEHFEDPPPRPPVFPAGPGRGNDSEIYRAKPALFTTLAVLESTRLSSRGSTCPRKNARFS